VPPTCGTWSDHTCLELTLALTPALALPLTPALALPLSLSLTLSL